MSRPTPANPLPPTREPVDPRMMSVEQLRDEAMKGAAGVPATFDAHSTPFWEQCRAAVYELACRAALAAERSSDFWDLPKREQFATVCQWLVSELDFQEIAEDVRQAWNCNAKEGEAIWREDT